jgi:hypothetical protein
MLIAASAGSNSTVKDASIRGSYSGMRDAPQAVRCVVPRPFTESAATEEERGSLRTITVAPKAKKKGSKR